MENQEQNTATVPDNQEQNTVQGISDETKEKLKALPLPKTGGKKQGGKKSVYLDQMTLLQQREERHQKEKMIQAELSSLSTLNDDVRDIEANFTMSNDDQKDASEPVEYNAGKFSVGLIISAIDDEKAWMTKITLCIILWSCLCANGASELQKMAEKNPGGSAEAWIDHLDKANKPLSVIGSLFSFSLVFRFKVCYDRWWVGRGKWLDIITNCLDLSMQSYRWFSNRDFADNTNRYLIVYAYACKAQLRGESIKDVGGDGEALVLRGHLSMEELEDIHNYPSWQPHYCTEMMREIHQASMLQSGSFYLEPVKMHGQLYRCFDNTIKNLINLIGDCISLQSSQMPVAYDGIHLLVFFVYFTFAAAIWSVSLSWLVVPLEFAVSSVVLLFIVLGTKLVDPFGTDAVDIPIHDFCDTVEAQLCAIKARADRGTMKKFAVCAVPSPKNNLRHKELHKRQSYRIGKLN